jgi:RNA polymerase sigma-70 factor, ECF subfamily
LGSSTHAAQGNALRTEGRADQQAAPGPAPDDRVGPIVAAEATSRFRRGVVGSPPAGGDLRPLVDAAQAGDREALDDLVRLTYRGTYTLAFRLTGHEDDARDVVQEAYLRAYRALGRFRGDAQFTTWLYRITANCAANQLAARSRSRTEPLPEDAPVPDIRAEHDPELRMAGEDDRARVAGALAVLPWRLRQVIVLRDIYDLPHGSIATELGISEAAAKVRLHRARRRLRELLSNESRQASDARAS